MKKQTIGPMPVLGLTLVGGAVGIVLRLRMLSIGYDGRGIQISNSWTYVTLWVLSGLFLLGLALLCRRMGDRAGCEENFPASPLAAVGAFLGAVGLLACSTVKLLGNPDIFDLIVNILGLAAASALAVSGYLRLSGRQSAAALMVVSLYLATWLVSQFRRWSADPQLGDYCFQLLACVFAMLASYQLAGFPLKRGRRRAALFCTMAAVFFCLISLVDGAAWPFYAAIALWLLTGGCSLSRPAPRRRKLGGGFEEEREQPASEAEEDPEERDEP